MISLQQKHPYDIAVVGAGPAGLAAAIAAKQTRPAARICIVERNASAGVKLLITGGGRCNITNSNVVPQNYVSHDLSRVQSVLKSFPSSQTIDWLQRLGIPLKIEDRGRMFPQTEKARTVLDCLMSRIRNDRTDVLFGMHIRTIEPLSNGLWRILTFDNQSITAAKVIIATGGAAWPRTGSDGILAASIAKHLQMQYVAPCPALAPIMLKKNGTYANFQQLSGISLDVILTLTNANTGKMQARISGTLLWTHSGVSGPAALDISTELARSMYSDTPVRLFLGHPQFTELPHALDALLKARKEHPQMLVKNWIREWWPERMGTLMCSELNEKRLTDLNKTEQQTLARRLHATELFPKSQWDWNTCEVSSGGVELQQLHPKTLESSNHKGLYFCGEILDVAGRVGGYNLQWAWSSGQLTGRAAAISLS